jgi:hypothetical protein
VPADGGAGGGGGGGDDEDARSAGGGSSDSDSAHVVPVPPDGSDMVCAVCGEPFRKAYDDGAESWVYRGAVVIDGEYYHASCASSLHYGVGGDGGGAAGSGLGSPRGPDVEGLEGGR